ncbi:AMP-binding protein [Streptomyces sp. NPDC054833]
MCRHAAATPENIALRGDGDQWTYRQLRDASVRYAGALAAAGLSPGDRVLLAAPSVPEFVVAYLGIQVAGRVGPTGKILKRSIDRTALSRDTAPADVALH